MDPNPVDNLYFHITPRPAVKRFVTSYHVTFLINPVQRTWCIESQVMKCSECVRLHLPRDERLEVISMIVEMLFKPLKFRVNLLK